MATYQKKVSHQNSHNELKLESLYLPVYQNIIIFKQYIIPGLMALICTSSYSGG